MWIYGDSADVAGSSVARLLRTPAEKLTQSRGLIQSFSDSYSFDLPSGKGADPDGSTRLRFAVGRNWLMTLYEGEVDAVEQLLARDEEETERGKLSATSLMADLLMGHLEILRRELASIERGVDELDENILRSRHAHDPLLALTVLRRRVSRLRRVVNEIRPTISTLTRPGFNAILTEADRTALHGIKETIDRLTDEVVRTRESVVGSYNLYTTKVSQDTNAILQVLTVVTVITGCIGAIAGVFGMNFQTPFFQEGARAFHLVVTLMSLFAVLMSALIYWRLRSRWR